MPLRLHEPMLGTAEVLPSFMPLLGSLDIRWYHCQRGSVIVKLPLSIKWMKEKLKISALGIWEVLGEKGPIQFLVFTYKRHSESGAFWFLWVVIWHLPQGPQLAHLRILNFFFNYTLHSVLFSISFRCMAYSTVVRQPYTLQSGTPWYSSAHRHHP